MTVLELRQQIESNLTVLDLVFLIAGLCAFCLVVTTYASKRK